MNSPKELDNSAVNDSGLEIQETASEVNQVHEILSLDANSESGNQLTVSDENTELPSMELVEESSATEAANSGSGDLAESPESSSLPAALRMEVVENKPVVLVSNETVVPADSARIRMEEVGSAAPVIEVNQPEKSEARPEVKLNGIREIETLPPVLRNLVTGSDVAIQREDNARIQVDETLTDRQIDLLKIYVQQNPDFNPDKIESNVQLDEFLRSNLVIDSEPLASGNKPHISSRENASEPNAEAPKPVDFSRLLAQPVKANGPVVIRENLEYISTATTLSVAQVEAARVEAARLQPPSKPESAGQEIESTVVRTSTSGDSIVTDSLPPVIKLNPQDRTTITVPVETRPQINVLAQVMEVEVVQPTANPSGWHLYNADRASEKPNPVVVRSSDGVSGTIALTRTVAFDSLPQTVGSGSGDVPVVSETTGKPLPNILARLVKDSTVRSGDSTPEVAPVRDVVSITDRPQGEPILVSTNFALRSDTIITAPEIEKLAKVDNSDIKDNADAELVLVDRAAIARRLGYASESELNSATFNMPEGRPIKEIQQPTISVAEVSNANSALARLRVNAQITQPEFVYSTLPQVVASEGHNSDARPPVTRDHGHSAKLPEVLTAVRMTDIATRPVESATLPTANQLVSRDTILTSGELDRLEAGGIKDENVAAERFQTREQYAGFLGFRTVAELNNADFNRTNGVSIPTLDVVPIDSRHADLADTTVVKIRENTRETQPHLAALPTFVSGVKRELAPNELAQIIAASAPVVVARDQVVNPSGLDSTIPSPSGRAPVVSNDASPIFIVNQDGPGQSVTVVRPEAKSLPAALSNLISSARVETGEVVCSGDTCTPVAPERPAVVRPAQAVVETTNTISRIGNGDSYTPEQLVKIERLQSYVRPEKLEGLSGEQVSTLYAATVGDRPVVTAGTVAVSPENRPGTTPVVSESIGQRLATVLNSGGRQSTETGTIVETNAGSVNSRTPQNLEVASATTRLSALLADPNTTVVTAAGADVVESSPRDLARSYESVSSREINQTYFNFLDNKNTTTPAFQQIARGESRVDSGTITRGYDSSFNAGSTIEAASRFGSGLNLSRSSVRFDGQIDLIPSKLPSTFGFENSNGRIDGSIKANRGGARIDAIVSGITPAAVSPTQFDYGFVRKISETYVASESAKSAVSHSAFMQVTGNNIKFASDAAQSFATAESAVVKSGVSSVSFVNILTGSIVDSSAAGAQSVKVSGISVGANATAALIASDLTAFDGSKTPIVGLVKVDGQNILVGNNTSGQALGTRIDISNGTPKIDGKAVNISLEGLVNITKVDLTNSVKAINTQTASGVAATANGIKSDAANITVKPEQTGNNKPESSTKADTNNTVKAVDNTIQVAKTFINNNTAPQLIAAIKYGDKLPEGMTYENGYIKLVHNGQVLYFPGLKAALKFVEGLGIQVDFDEDEDDGQWHVESLDAKGNSARVQYVVVPGDTLESIAEQRLGDVRYKDLIVTINRSEIVYRLNNGIKAPFVYPSQVLWLPSRYELKVFRKNFFSDSNADATISGSVKCERAATMSLPNSEEIEATGLLKKLHEEVVEHYKPKSNPQSNFGPDSGPLASALDKVRFAGGRESVDLLQYPQSIGRLSQRNFYQVIDGDTLISIARKSESLGDTRFWKLIAKVNGLTTRLDAFGIPCEALVPGQHLLMPDPKEIAQFAKEESVAHPLVNIEPKSCSVGRNDTVITSQVEVFSYAPDCRVTVVNYSNNQEDFCVNLQYQEGSEWKTIATYQSTKNGKAVRTTYAKHGVTSSLVIDLPPAVVREMAIEEFSKSWNVRARAYAQGNATDSKNYFVPSIPQLKARQS